MKKTFIVLISIFLCSCTYLCPQPKQPLLQDQQSFVQAFEDFQTTHSLDKLQKLVVDFPDSVWASRAETIILYSQEVEQRKVQNEKISETVQQQALEMEKLEKMNQQLTEKLEQFKSLLIQSEQHPQ